MKKKLCYIFFVIFSLIFFSSCSKKSPMTQKIPLHLNEVLSDSQIITESNPLISAYTSFSSDVVISEYKTDFATVLYPRFNNETLNQNVLDIIKRCIDTQVFDAVVNYDLFVSSGERGISLIFYDESDFDNAFYITLSDDFSKVLGLEDVVSLSRLNDSCEHLFGKVPVIGDDLFCNYYLSEKGVTVRDVNGISYDIPNEYIDASSYRKPIVGDNYSPVTDVNEKVIALTFDDGPNYYTTPELLKTLKEKDVKATFFVVGYNIPGNEHILRRMIELDCDIGIHSYSHSNFYAMTKEQVISDIKRCSDLVENATGIAPHLVRPPFGNIQDEIVKEKEYYYINWCVDPVDWNAKSAEDIANHVIKYAGSGSIVLLHDIHKISCDAAGIIIDKLKADGWRFVTVSELLNLRDNEPNGEIYYSLRW